MNWTLVLPLVLASALSISITDKMDRMMMAESREGPYVRDQDLHPMMKLIMNNIYPSKNHPYTYMKDPMASVSLGNVPARKVTPYQHELHASQHHQQNKDHPHPHARPQPLAYTHTRAHAKPYHHTFQDMMSYMVGEEYFKNQNEDIINFLNEPEEDNDEEQLPYEVLQNYGSYEKRRIASAQYVCAHEKVDTAADPLAGLTFRGVEDALEVMQSNRWSKLPSSQMFKKLFKYISGVNERAEEINMTRPVTTLHHVERRDYLGNVEIQEMCFYLPSKYQPNHKHEEAGPSLRHSALEPPQPLDHSVFIHTRPEMEVYVRRFGGFMMSQEQWEEQREALENDLVGKPHHDNEFFTVGYSSPFNFNNRRNEVWVQCLEAGNPVVEAIVAVGHWEDEDLDDKDDLDHHTLDNKKRSGKPAKHDEKNTGES